MHKYQINSVLTAKCQCTAAVDSTVQLCEEGNKCASNVCTCKDDAPVKGACKCKSTAATAGAYCDSDGKVTPKCTPDLVAGAACHCGSDTVTKLNKAEIGDHCSKSGTVTKKCTTSVIAADTICHCAAGNVTTLKKCEEGNKCAKNSCTCKANSTVKGACKCESNKKKNVATDGAYCASSGTVTKKCEPGLNESTDEACHCGNGSSLNEAKSGDHCSKSGTVTKKCTNTTSTLKGKCQCTDKDNNTIIQLCDVGNKCASDVCTCKANSTVKGDCKCVNVKAKISKDATDGAYCASSGTVTKKCEPKKEAKEACHCGSGDALNLIAKGKKCLKPVSSKTTKKTDTTKTKPNVGLICGLVFGSIAVCTLIGAMLYFYSSKSDQSNPAWDEENPTRN